ncbi:MAG: hypothetical protein J6D00_08575 [Christensenellaceae bacterium]|nr:hypothetical protein [Christensenellaceae bacterium]
MGNYINDKGYICYVRSGYSMSHTHGANSATAELHKREFEEIANNVADGKLQQIMPVIEKTTHQIVNEYGRTVWASLIRELVGALETDVHSQVNVGFDGLREVFYGEKCQKYISDSIMKTLLNELSKIRTK